MTTSQRKIAEAYVDNLKNKIDRLTANLPDETEKAMKIFRKLINHVEENMEFEEVSYKDVYKLVNGLKKSNSRGENELTNEC